MNMSDDNSKTERAGGAVCEDGVCRPYKSPKTSSSASGSKTTTGSKVSSTKSSSSPASSLSAPHKIRIHIISDTMCPWCWVGKRNLELALKEAATWGDDRIEAKIRWYPFFLDKDLDEEGTLTQDYYQKNYHGDAQTGERMKGPLMEAGKLAGIDFTKYCQITQFFPTIRSHRLIEYAHQHGKQNEMVEELFRMFCEQGFPLNSIPHLVQAAQRVLGLKDTDHVRRYLESDLNQAKIFALADSVRDMANGVPTFIFSLPGYDDDEGEGEGEGGAGPRHYTLSGAQSPQVYQRVFETLIMRKKRLDKLDHHFKN